MQYKVISLKSIKGYQVMNRFFFRDQCDIYFKIKIDAMSGLNHYSV